MRWWLVLALVGCRETAPVPRATGYLKGALHVHSNNSGDSKTPPEDVARWYRDHHFDFLVFTDHNRITSVAAPGILAIPGAELTQNLETCDPPPEPGLACLLHVNALFVTDTGAIGWRPPEEVRTRRALYGDALAETKRLGGIAQLNHPNFHWAADAALIRDLVGDGIVLFEVANQGSDVNNAGDATHPSTEALWDAVLTAGGRLYGTATDDAHFYDDAAAQPGNPDVGDRGWVMVHAARDRQAIRAALLRGDFYASTGVMLSRVEQRGGELAIEVESPGEHAIAFIGPRGEVLATTRGRSASLSLAGHHGYVRATVTDAAGHRAWVEPVFLP